MEESELMRLIEYHAECLKYYKQKAYMITAQREIERMELDIELMRIEISYKEGL